MTTPQADRLIGITIDGRYRVVRRLASGGMATVYIAVDERLDRDVALKVMHPHLAQAPGGADFVARFRREAKAAARLAHPNLVAVHDQGIDGGVSYLVMELVSGTNLRARVNELPPLRVREALAIIEDVLSAVATVHHAGLVHRDIKPENILLSADGRVKVADFGLARAVTEVTAASTGTIFGTVAYLAPELIDRGYADARTDIYAIGATFYEVLTGKPLFGGSTAIQIALQHLNAPSPLVRESLPWLPTEVEQLLAGMIARDPDDRFTDATAAKTSLRQVRAQLSEQVLDMPVLTPAALEDEPTDEIGSRSSLDQASADHDSEPAIDSGEIASADAHPNEVSDLASPPTESTGAVANAGVAHTLAIDMQRTLPHRLLQTEDSSPAVSDPGRAGRRRSRFATRLVIGLVIVLAIAGGGYFVYNGVGPGAYRMVPQAGTVGAADSAEQALIAAGFDTSRTSEYSDTVRAGQLITTDPEAGTRVRKGSTVELVVSLGVQHFEVPTKLIGSRKAAAITAIKEAGFAEPTITTAYYDDVDKGAVTAVSVPEGSQQPHDTLIALTVSGGKQPVQIPNVVGHPQKDAKKDVEALRLTWHKADSQYSDTVPRGSVISQDPVAGTSGHVLDTVTVVVSRGPELVVVPDVRGLSEDGAVTELLNAGLKFEVNRYLGAYFDKVRFQSEEPNSEVPKGTKVTITVW
ncbi:Stk1 family PASTA domain-containing Ser/Thr kinase [Rarobacter faecitabidus]|uniref:non-specific serine/threonine protein kinase n=1 Tax=Rarobacter faecitabidus TaxID=13243 RepID=A0A542ZVJ3_RARFA|nr:Stk1 family PASTA domain-containing Ser/Thr kinase [Rarobacter faecitabidus]TQL64341.1 serine/threonine-protein kinase [Rarobacter faecitabidus]